MPEKRQIKSGFTLLELMVVIGVMSVMLVIAVPAFLSMGEGSSLRASGAELRATLALARQWAIAHREDTFVVFPDDLVTSYPDAESRKKGLRAYAVYTRSEGYVSEWHYLANGVMFDPVENMGSRDNNVFDARDSGNNRVTLFEDLVDFPLPGDTQNAMYAIGFGADGWLRLTQTGIIDIDIHITEGTVNPTDLSYVFRPNRRSIVINVDERSAGFRYEEYDPAEN